MRVVVKRPGKPAVVLSLPGEDDIAAIVGPDARPAWTYPVRWDPAFELHVLADDDATELNLIRPSDSMPVCGPIVIAKVETASVRIVGMTERDAEIIARQLDLYADACAQMRPTLQ